jgi:hypothetical protein
MRDIALDIINQDRMRIETVRIDGQEITRLRREAGDAPAAPGVARWLEAFLGQKGFKVSEGKAPLLEAAGLMLSGEAGSILLKVRRVEPLRPPLTDFASGVDPVVFLDSGYSPKALEDVAARLRSEGYVAAFWNPHEGLRFEAEETDRFSVGGNAPLLKDPLDLFSFVIKSPGRRVAYILEDVEGVVGPPGSGERRARFDRMLENVREALASRDERIVLLRSGIGVAAKPASGGVREGASGSTGRSLLETHGVVLTDPQRLRRARPVVAMEGIIQRLAQVLCQMESNNPLLIGHPGVGKTAAVEGLARLMTESGCPAPLRGRNLYSLSLTSVVAGTRYRGDLEERVDALMREVLAMRDHIVVFIDEIHTLVKAGSAEGGLGVSEALKPALARGEFPCIGATSFEGERIFLADPALGRRFKRVVVNEPDRDTAVRILEGVAPSFERHHGVRIDPRALAAAVDAGIEKFPEVRLPGIAISIIDGACAHCSMNRMNLLKSSDIFDEVRRILNYS